MKKSFLFGLATTFVMIACAQPGKVKPVSKPAAPVFKTLMDSASYAIGISVGNYYKKQGMTKLNAAMVSKAIDDIMSGKKVMLDEAVANNALNSCMTSLKSEISKTNIEEGEKFLAQNKIKTGVITTRSGLQYQVLTEGTGIKPTATDQVTCNYKGALLNGTEFDNSYTRGQPATFALNQVIPGWTEGLQLMTVGSKYRFWIPYNLGYGLMGYSSIPGGALLVFEVELLDVKK
jgi:FKBP-type peptidyl-prolyl cis-trans isomerase